MTDEPREIDDLDEDDIFDGEGNDDPIEDTPDNEPVITAEKMNSRNNSLKKKQGIARHRIEDLIEEKKLSKKLDYFDEDQNLDEENK